MPTLTEAAVAPVARAVRGGWRWWTGELKAMLPRQLELGNRGAGTTDIWLSRDSLIVDRVVGRQGARFVEELPIEAVADDSWAQLAELTQGTRTRIILAPPDVYTLRCRLPRAARSHLRAAVALQLNELSPIAPALIDWAMHPPVRTGDRLEVAVTLVQKARVEQLAALFAAHGLALPPVFGAADERIVKLGEGADHAGGSGGRWAMGRLIATCALLLASIPVTTIVAADLLARSNDRASDRLEAALAPQLAAERRAHDEEAVRALLAPIAAAPGATATLVTLADKLPATAWVPRAERQADGALALTVDATDPDSVRGALEDAASGGGYRELDQRRTDDGHIEVHVLTDTH